jgi:hypothetical protein
VPLMSAERPRVGGEGGGVIRVLPVLLRVPFFLSCLIYNRARLILSMFSFVAAALRCAAHIRVCQGGVNSCRRIECFALRDLGMSPMASLFRLYAGRCRVHVEVPLCGARLDLNGVRLELVT